MAKKTTALANWDEELARQAKEYAEQEANTGGGTFFTSRNGVLKFNDAPIENNEMAVIVLDSCFENIYYEEDFDADNRTNPACYALGRDEAKLAPHEQSETPQAPNCEECEHSKWGSARKGKGKACRNRRRLALIPAGSFAKDGSFEQFDDIDAFAKSSVAYLGIPPTSINSFGAYLKNVEAVLRRPLYAVFTKVSLVDDEKTQQKWVFENLGKVPDELIALMMERNKAQRPLTMFPYPKAEAAPVKSKQRQYQQPKKKAARF